ncbi:peptide methionine sulfoxide reductase MsrA 1 isoform X1 [Rhinichthys klamathensis goyatoka]|uniref:peptide methionine sulfoxide reductase MsrA 1 isoform X1 n=2 Tax=Rhinichthys klamathensis goyatoka TaxID=3034132 RepID=UPI0024B61C52|nr:peptide methionine sulfoxide reductase MsrA 1 isoform X1 [Rhinichthys klamathensis goyatoka]
MRWARLSPHSSFSSMAAARTCLFLQAGAHTVVILIVIVLQLDFRVTVAQLNMANKSVLTAKERSLKGREEKMVVAVKHTAIGNPTVEPFPDSMEMIMFGMGCFWGAERRFWRIPGVFSTQVGYAGGFTPNPTYHEVCSGLTGHTEVVRVVFSPEDISLEKLLKVFWESHDPTQGMAQGNDHGTQYRSAIYTYSPEQQELAMMSKHMYQEALARKGLGEITTEIREHTDFYYAEDYHQQYLHKVPKGYCGLKGTGVTCSFEGEKDEL